MDRHLRIALVVPPYPLLRPDDHAPALARELLGRGHTVRGFGAPPGMIPRSGPPPSVDGGVVPEEGIGLLGFAPDVIVAYDALSPAAWLGARRARRLRAPLVLVEEGLSFGGKRVERVLRGLGERFWGAYVRRTATRVVALDRVGRDRAVNEGFAPSRVSVVPAGVDLSVYRPGLSSHIPSSHGIRGRMLLHIGRLEPNRGLGVLVSAFAATVGRRDDWSLVFVGDGAERVRLRAQVDRLGAGSRVHWLPYPRREELAGLLGASTLVAVPALGDDVSSHKVRRALACGVPVLASDVPRLRDLVENDGCGLLAPPGDVAAWTEMLRSASNSPVRRERWGRRARAIAEERFAWPVLAETLEGVLQGAIAELAASRAKRAAGGGDGVAPAEPGA